MNSADAAGHAGPSRPVLARSSAWSVLLSALLLAPAAAQDGRALYLEHCASCQGQNLEGQPDWMQRGPDGRLPAPPHDASGHTWHHSDAQLLQIVRDGLGATVPGYETNMPSFGDVLTGAEIKAVLDYIKSTWPERERRYQQARSEADR